MDLQLAAHWGLGRIGDGGVSKTGADKTPVVEDGR